jgi:anaerobic magnesium-protoporphyrin IX monomethyl ester cyclase
MKILLINPPFSKEEIFTKSMSKVGAVLPPLGLAYIAAVLEKENFQVKIIDGFVLSSLKRYTFKNLEKDIKTFFPDIIGITSTSPQICNAVKTAQIAKKINPSCITFIGGSHITALPEILKDFKVFDYGIYGESEISFAKILNKIRNNDNIEGSDGLIWLSGNNINVKKPELIKNIDDLPFPAWHLLPMKMYKPSPANYRSLPAINLMTSRGCPFNCVFCHKPIFGKMFRPHSAKRVVEEIEYVQKNYGIKDIQFFDDTFTLNKQRVIDICNIIIKKRIKINWNCMTRVDCVNEELLKLMKKAGCYEVTFGIESGSERILNLINKGTNKKQDRFAVSLAKKAKLDTRASYMLGFPTETKEEIKETIKFAKELNTDIAQFMLVTPYPDTKLWDLCKADGHIEVGDWSNFTFYAPKGAPFIPSTITKKELNKIYIKAIKSYYLRPSFIFSQLLKIRTFEDIKRKVIAAKAVIGL